MRLTPKLTIALAVMQLAAPLGAKTSEPIPLAKQGPWEINYDIDACHLIAKFGGEGNWIIARFSRFAPGDLFYLDLFCRILFSFASLFCGEMFVFLGSCGAWCVVCLPKVQGSPSVQLSAQ